MLVRCFSNLLLLLAFPFLLSAQQRADNRLLLKNGQVLEGRILHKGKTFTDFLTLSGDTLLFRNRDIRLFNFDADQPITKGKGWGFEGAMGILAGSTQQQNFYFYSGENGANYVSTTFHASVEYRFVPSFALALESGVDAYPTVILAPLGLAIRGDLKKQAFTPTYSFSVGRGLAWAKDQEDVEARGGMYFSPALGFKKYITSGTALTFLVGYRWQRTEIIYQGYWISDTADFTQKTTYRRLVARLGFAF